MSCCKVKNNFKKENNDKPSNLITRLFQFIVVLVLTLIASPVIISIILIMLFQSIVLNKRNDLTNILNSIIEVKNKISNKNADVEDTEDAENVEDYDIIGLEKINKE